MINKVKTLILDKIEALKLHGKQGVVIFDLDDTLIDCRHRKIAVIKRFTEQLEVYSPHKEKLESLKVEQIAYRIAHCLENAQIDDKNFGKEMYDFWLNHYFSTPFLVNDQLFPKAADFVIELWKAGAKIIYLTARHKPEMEQGTIEFLKESPLPFPAQNVELLLKPHQQMGDDVFKQLILPEIASKGEVVASFENELKHLNHMADYFPEAIMVWRDTLYAPDPPSPHPRVMVLKEF